MVRLSPETYRNPWGDADRCPCGSGGTFDGCCKVAVRRLPHVAVPSTRPPSPVTGNAEDRCYLKNSFDCSNKISREHYISRVILDEFDGLSVGGLPWQADGEQLQVSSSALVAKILCTRHNSALEPLDTLAFRAFRALVDGPQYVFSQRRPGRIAYHLISGDALELWFIKLLAGLYYGRIATHGRDRLLGRRTMDDQALRNALLNQNLAPGAGLYVAQQPGEMLRRGIRAAPLSNVALDALIGIRVEFGTVAFDTLLTAPPDQSAALARNRRRHRPGLIDFHGPQRDARLVLSWRGNGNVINRFEIVGEG